MLSWFWEMLTAITAVMTFFSLFLLGAMFSTLSLVFGGHGDGDHDVGHELFGHDVSGHDASHDSHHGSDHHDGDHGHGISDFFSVGMFSVRGMALLSTGFGGFGFLAQIYTGRLVFSTTVGLLGGYVFAFLVLYTLKVFRSQQANSLVSMDGAVGNIGIVTISVPPQGVGEVSFTISGSELIRMAVSKDGTPIRSGTSVRVEEIHGSTLVVAPYNP